MKPVAQQLVESKRSLVLLAILGFFILPFLYSIDVLSIGQINMIGRYMTFAILALGLDLLWGYVGILSLCQCTFFCLGAYAMGMHLAHHGGPEGIIDANGWKLPACLFVVYPYDVGESSGDALVPFFWKPFWNLPLTILLGLLIPAVCSFVLGYFVFRSRVRGVYFAILSQAIAVAGWLVFCRNDVKLCGTNGLTRFDVIAPAESLTTFHPEDAKDQWIASHDGDMGQDLNEDGKLDQLDYSMAEVGFSLSEPNVQLSLYLLTLACLFGSFFLCKWIVNSRLGRVLIAIRDDESTLNFFGYKPHQYKIFAFCIAAALAGLAGMLYIPQMKIITPSNMEAVRSVLVVVWVAVGGRGTLRGAILGALTVNLLYNYLTSEHDYGLFSWSPDYWPIFLGIAFVLVVLYLPNGLIEVVDRFRDRFGNKPNSNPIEKV
jgi:urea transport system permease protein